MKSRKLLQAKYYAMTIVYRCIFKFAVLCRQHARASFSYSRLFSPPTTLIWCFALLRPLLAIRCHYAFGTCGYNIAMWPAEVSITPLWRSVGFIETQKRLKKNNYLFVKILKRRTWKSQLNAWISFLSHFSHLKLSLLFIVMCFYLDLSINFVRLWRSETRRRSDVHCSSIWLCEVAFNMFWSWEMEMFLSARLSNLIFVATCYRYLENLPK